MGAAANRVLFASGYPTVPRSTSGYGSQGLVLLDVDAVTGGWSTGSPHAMGSSGASSCTSGQQRAVLADIALARDWSRPRHLTEPARRLRRATPGAIPSSTCPGARPRSSTRAAAGSRSISRPRWCSSTSCRPGRFPPKNRIYLVQVTNSNLDPETRTYTDASGPYPGSQLVVTKLAWSGVAGDPPTIDSSYDGDGHIVLATDASDAANRICLDGTTFTKTKADTCTGLVGELPPTARPVGTPTVIMRSDGLGFQVITGWYDWTAHSNDCTSTPNFNYGTSYVTVHEFGADGMWYQIAGFTFADTVLTGGTFVGTGFFLDGIMGGNNDKPMSQSFGQSIVSLQQLLNASGLERYSRTSWTERME